jgi:hypothetical protein
MAKTHNDNGTGAQSTSPCRDNPSKTPGKTTLRQRLTAWSNPFSTRNFYPSLWNLVLRPNRHLMPWPVSRATSFVFLLDPPAYYVWPYPRLERHPTLGAMLARLIMTVKNPGLKAREVQRTRTKNGQESLAWTDDQVQRDLNWRYSMFCSYGDKWPVISD